MPRTTDPDALSLKPSTGVLRGERARPDFSAVHGEADTVPATEDISGASSPASADPTPTATGAQHYVVQPGDTLSGIAQRYYGRASEWHRIHEANRHAIEDPDLIQPGQELNIPEPDEP